MPIDKIVNRVPGEMPAWLFSTLLKGGYLLHSTTLSCARFEGACGATIVSLRTHKAWLPLTW